MTMCYFVSLVAGLTPYYITIVTVTVSVGNSDEATAVGFTEEGSEFKVYTYVVHTGNMYARYHADVPLWMHL